MEVYGGRSQTRANDAADVVAGVHVAGDLWADVAPRRTRVWGYEPGPPAGTWSPREGPCRDPRGERWKLRESEGEEAVRTARLALCCRRFR